jgi:hypothetical protein
MYVCEYVCMCVHLVVWSACACECAFVCSECVNVCLCHVCDGVCACGFVLRMSWVCWLCECICVCVCMYVCAFGGAVAVAVLCCVCVWYVCECVRVNGVWCGCRCVVWCPVRARMRPVCPFLCVTCVYVCVCCAVVSRSLCNAASVCARVCTVTLRVCNGQVSVLRCVAHALCVSPCVSVCVDVLPGCVASAHRCRRAVQCSADHAAHSHSHSCAVTVGS